MRSYELIYIIHPDMDDSAVNEIQERVTGWIAHAGGDIIETEIQPFICSPLFQIQDYKKVFMIPFLVHIILIQI